MYMKIEQNNRIEEMLNSIDGCRKATAPDFFYTRLKARMEKEILKPVAQKWILRPAFAAIALMLVLLVNGFVLLQKNQTDDNLNIAVSETETMQSIASEYSLNVSNSLYDLTQEK